MPGQDDWMCRTCTGSDGKPWRNAGHREACIRCGLKKGVCFKAKVAPKEPSISVRPTFAENQCAQQKEAEFKRREQQQKQQQQQRKDKDKDKQLEKLRKENEQLKAAAQKPGTAADEAAEEEPGEDTDAVHLARVRMFEGQLAALPKGDFAAEERTRLEGLLEAARTSRRAAWDAPRRVSWAEQRVATQKTKTAKSAEKREQARTAVEEAQKSLEEADRKWDQDKAQQKQLEEQLAKERAALPAKEQPEAAAAAEVEGEIDVGDKALQQLRDQIGGSGDPEIDKLFAHVENTLANKRAGAATRNAAAAEAKAKEEQDAAEAEEGRRKAGEGAGGAGATTQDLAPPLVENGGKKAQADGDPIQKLLMEVAEDFKEGDYTEEQISFLKGMSAHKKQRRKV